MSPRRSEKRVAAPRRRRTAEASRARILAAAERKLAQVGPQGLRLAELAEELDISHPAILHHFGSREALVASVVARAVARFNERLAGALVTPSGQPGVVLDMIAEFFGAEGNARLIAWLVLSGRAQKPRARAKAKPFKAVIDIAHALRTQAAPKAVTYEDTKFRGHLAALALLGDAIFGDLIRVNSGDAPGPRGSRDFRKRLAALLSDES